jgi:hypothetical protein
MPNKLARLGDYTLTWIAFYYNFIPKITFDFSPYDGNHQWLTFIM